MTTGSDLPRHRNIVLVGLMGAGKTSVGKRLARRLGLPFVDADDEIVKAAGCSISDIFKNFGEQSFREGECRVIERVLAGGPLVLATGGGAFMNEQTRESIRGSGVSVWLSADLETLYQRTRRRNVRPLLQNDDPKGTLERLMEQRNPVYATADITIHTEDERPDVTVDRIVQALDDVR